MQKGSWALYRGFRVYGRVVRFMGCKQVYENVPEAQFPKMEGGQEGDPKLTGTLRHGTVLC